MEAGSGAGYVRLVFGQFHQRCGERVELSAGRRVASGRTYSIFERVASVYGFCNPPSIAFSNDPVPKGVQFSVKVLREAKQFVSLESKDNVSPLIQTPCSLKCMPCLDSAHTTAVNSQLVSCRLV